MRDDLTMDDLASLISENRSWLLERVLFYACQQSYMRADTMGVDALRSFIDGFTQSLMQSLHKGDSIRPLHSEDKFTDDPVSLLAMQEARLRYRQGFRLAYFLGLLKYCRQGYLDLLQEKWNTHPATQYHSTLTIHRFFDRLELAFCTGWVHMSDHASPAELALGKEILCWFLPATQSCPPADSKNSGCKLLRRARRRQASRRSSP